MAAAAREEVVKAAAQAGEAAAGTGEGAMVAAQAGVAMVAPREEHAVVVPEA